MSAELVVTANVTAIEIALQIRDRVARNADLESDRLLARFKEARDAIAGFAQPTLAQVLALRCGLSDIELLAIWTLTAAAVSEHVRQLAVALGADKSGGQTSLVLGTILGGAGVARYSTLSPMAVLRRLALIERSDGGGPDVHESRWTWAISRRVLAFLHGDLSIDPGVWITASQKLRLDLARR